jgi:hypothetical protein
MMATYGWKSMVK